MNLAIRDIATLCDTVRDAKVTGQDIGQAGLIGYERWRRVDETALSALTAGLSQAPKRGPASIFGHMRRTAFAATQTLSRLHPLLIQEARGELGDVPSLLR